MFRKILFAAILFVALQLLFLELHERVHIITGRIICGCWGTRDFSEWKLCATCANPDPGILATMTAPIFTLCVCVIAALLTNSTNEIRRFTGFFVLFANAPFIRLMAVAQGGSDESEVWRHFFEGRLSHFWLRAGILIIVAAVLVPVLVTAYRNMTGRWKIIGFALLCYLPGLTQRYMLEALNALLHHGVLAQPWGMGSPMLITLVFAINILLVVICRKMLLNTSSRVSYRL